MSDRGHGTELSSLAYHTILLSYSRELRIGRVENDHAVVLYIPEAERSELRKLAIRANLSDLNAIKQLAALPRKRITSRAPTLEDALCGVFGRLVANKEIRQIAEYCELMHWTERKTA